jgi:hypothetical protein
VILTANRRKILNDSMRQQVLFQITASCRFWWSGLPGETNFATGKTRDLGSGGVCVIADVLPSPGAVVMLEIDLPRPGDPLGQLQPDLLLRAEGTVLRHQGNEREFVVMITYATLDREPQGEGSKRLEGHFDTLH